VSTRVLRSHAKNPRSLYGDQLRSKVPRRIGIKKNSYIQAQSFTKDDSDKDVRAFTEDAEGQVVYWNHLSMVSLKDFADFPCFLAILAYVETSHYMVLAVHALGIPKSFD
jgi:hypothetical protein